LFVALEKQLGTIIKQQLQPTAYKNQQDHSVVVV
jgi:hypothetical protein